jgi:hypothetical protein
MSVKVNDVGIDFSGADIDARDAAHEGARFMLRYSAGTGVDSPNCQFKLCGHGEIAAAEKAGLDFIANSEFYESRVTEGAHAGAADGAADLRFWKARGLAKGASVYCSWDAAPVHHLFDRVAEYLTAYNHALGGYYHVDLYAGDDALREMRRRGIIRYGWRPNAGSWSNDPHGEYYQPPHHGQQLADKIRSLSPAHIWQNGNYWFHKGADENLILRVPVGSHLEAKHGSPQPVPEPTPHPTPHPTSHPQDTSHTWTDTTGGHHPDVVVKAGDTLTGIALRYPEATITARSIAAANVDRHPSLRDNPDHIEIGWALRIR